MREESKESGGARAVPILFLSSPPSTEQSRAEPTQPTEEEEEKAGEGSATAPSNLQISGSRPNESKRRQEAPLSRRQLTHSRTPPFLAASDPIPSRLRSQPSGGTMAAAATASPPASASTSGRDSLAATTVCLVPFRHLHLRASCGARRDSPTGNAARALCVACGGAWCGRRRPRAGCSTRPPPRRPTTHICYYGIRPLHSFLHPDLFLRLREPGVPRRRRQELRARPGRRALQGAR
jgi:hypothetical protein